MIIPTVIQRSKEMIRLLDSIEITTKRLIDSDWNNKRKLGRIFRGSYWFPTWEKVSLLRTWHYLYLSDALKTFQTKVPRSKRQGAVKQLAETDLDTLKSSLDEFLRQFSRDDKSEIYKALAGESKPTEILETLHGKILVALNILNNCKTLAEEIKNESSTGTFKFITKYF